MIKSIVFDLSEVYLNGVWKFSEKIGSSFNFFEDSKYYFTELMKGSITEDYFWEKTKEELKINESVETLKSLCRECFTVYDENIPVIIEELKNNYEVGLLSDHAKEWINYIDEKYKLSELFDFCIYSYQAGDIKLGNGKLFKLVIDNTGAEPSETLFIDNYDKNVERAESMGIIGIVYESSEKLIKDLRKLSVKI